MADKWKIQHDEEPRKLGPQIAIVNQETGYADALCGAVGIEEAERTAQFFLRAVNTHEALVTSYEQLEGAFLDALHELNDAGLPCPASLGLAIEKLRVIIGKAKKPA